MIALVFSKIRRKISEDITSKTISLVFCIETQNLRERNEWLWTWIIDEEEACQSTFAKDSCAMCYRSLSLYWVVLNNALQHRSSTIKMEDFIIELEGNILCGKVSKKKGDVTGKPDFECLKNEGLHFKCNRYVCFPLSSLNWALPIYVYWPSELHTIHENKQCWTKHSLLKRNENKIHVEACKQTEKNHFWKTVLKKRF